MPAQRRTHLSIYSKNNNNLDIQQGLYNFDSKQLPI